MKTEQGPYIDTSRIYFGGNVMPVLEEQEFNDIEDVMEFCRSERDRIVVPQADLRSLAESKARLVAVDPQRSVPLALAYIREALGEGRGFSLIRVGNGEGNAVSMTRPRLYRPAVDTFFQEFNSQNGLAIDIDAAAAFCEEVKAAILDGDMIGLRSLVETFGAEPDLIAAALARNDAYAVLGLCYAREFLGEQLRADAFADRTLTSAWIHLDFIPRLDALFAASDRIVVVTGRHELRAAFERRLGPKLEAFITVPAQGHRPERLEQSHLHDAFPQTKQRLTGDLRGCLVLVGAGLFGKIYCATAKRSGAVAIDLGSLFDVLCGLATRPVFHRYNLTGAAWI